MSPRKGGVYPKPLHLLQSQGLTGDHPNKGLSEVRQDAIKSTGPSSSKGDLAAGRGTESREAVERGKRLSR